MSWTGTVRPTFPSLLLLGLAACGEGKEAAGEPAGLAADSRIAYLLAPCARGYHYDVNTADVEGILLETLLHGQRDPLRRARSELAGLGASGIEIVTRVVREYWNQLDGKNHIRNALDVAMLSDDPSARELLLEVAGHPMEDLRMIAVRGLAKHGRAEDWEAISDLLGAASPTFLVELVQVLHGLDPTPTQELVLDWVEAGELEAFWNELLPLLADATDEDLVARCASLWPALGSAHRPSPAAACAAAGNEEALESLRTWRDDPENTTLRRIALLALARAGLLDELVPSLRRDGSPENRVLALGALAATPERTRRFRDPIVAGMSDPVESVSQACAEALARIGDAAAIDRGLALLAGDSAGSLQAGLRIVRTAFAADPRTAERALAVLEERLERDAHRPLAERLVYLAGIAQIPLEAASRRLLELADVAEGTLQGQPARRWLTLQAGNVGVAAHPELLARLEREPDAARRMDYLEALAVRGGPEARVELIEYVQGGRATPYEILLAADRLVRIGPAAEVAPVLKRVTLRVEQEDVRGALQCMLWASYPGPSN